MKQLVGVVVLLLIISNAHGQDEAKLDTVYRLGGLRMVVDVRKVTASSVTYVDPEKKGTKTLERKEIQKIIYHTGKIEEFNQPVFKMIDDYQWEAVVITEDPKDVEGLYERGTVTAKSSPSSRSAKASKRSCTIRMQKKAANMKGIIIYLTQKQSIGGYGEMPGYYMEGVVYGFEPLAEGEDKQVDKD